MKPALIQFFEDYGRKKGTALFKKHLSEMEGIEGGLTYGKIMKLSKEERPEFNSERYLNNVSHLLDKWLYSQGRWHNQGGYKAGTQNGPVVPGLQLGLLCRGWDFPASDSH